MKKNQSPYSKGINLDRVDLPGGLVAFFQQRGRFVRGLPGYEQIRGRNSYLPQEVEEDILFGSYKYETHSILNRDIEDRIKAENHAIEMASLVTRNKEKDISKMNRDYMLVGCSRPIRLKFLVDKKRKTSLYVKSPSVERIFGMYLYNLFSRNCCHDYIFNNYSFVEREVSGVHLDKENKKTLVSRPKFIDSAIRLATLDDFIAISDLERVSGPKKSFTNILVQYDGNIEAFDFNTFLQPFFEFERNPFLEALREQGVDISESKEREIASKEALRINSILEEKKNLFDKMIRIMDSVPYMRERIEEKGYESVREFFKDSRYKLKKKII